MESLRDRRILFDFLAEKLFEKYLRQYWFPKTLWLIAFHLLVGNRTVLKRHHLPAFLFQPKRTAKLFPTAAFLVNLCFGDLFFSEVGKFL